MTKFFVIAAAAVAVSAIGATSAIAADLHVSSKAVSAVHVPVAGKTSAQLAADIRAAADTVCATAGPGCVDWAVADANRQLATLRRVHDVVTKVEVARNDPTVVRVSLKDKTTAQILADVDDAARTVCKAANHSAISASYRSCVEASAADARQRLADITRRQQVAAN